MRRASPTRAAGRLLRALSEPGAHGVAGADDEPALLVAAPRRGAPARAVPGAKPDAEALCAEGLAAWSTDAGARPRLLITQAGRARLAREAAAAGVDPFFNQHRPVARAPAGAGEMAGVIFDAAESPLAWLATRKGRDGKPMIAPAELAAGERLRRDMTVAQMTPRMSADWSGVGGRGGRGPMDLSFSDMTLAARQRVGEALEAVGSDFAGLLIDVCGFLKGLEQVEGERGWPARSGKIVLRLGLRQLCRHYGVETEAVGPSRSTGMRHWGATDYRPRQGAAPGEAAPETDVRPPGPPARRS